MKDSKETKHMSIAELIDSLESHYKAKFSQNRKNYGNSQWNSDKIDKSDSELKLPKSDSFQPLEPIEPSVKIMNTTLQLKNSDSVSKTNSQESEKCWICLRSLDSNSEVCSINENQKCGHKFHKECIEDYINKKCWKIYAYEIFCPVIGCNGPVTLKSAIKILNSPNDIFRFECNFYLYRLTFKYKKWSKFIEFNKSEWIWSYNQTFINDALKLSWKDVLERMRYYDQMKLSLPWWIKKAYMKIIDWCKKLLRRWKNCKLSISKPVSSNAFERCKCSITSG